MSAGFLSEIVRDVRRAGLRDGAGEGLPPPRASPPPKLSSSIRRARDRGALVVEYKKVSPGQEDPRLPVRSIPEFLRATDVPGVAGYSCLATRPRFEGSPDDVAELARATDRPVLYKEFVVELRQLDLAARTGAGAVLLIARLEGTGLLDRPLAEFADRARDLGIEIVLEFQRGAELSVADGVEADVYGVNVRDLDSLALDRPTALATLAEAAGRGLRPLLGLSGVEGPEEAGKFWEVGADGLLVGTAVARARDPARFLASLRRSSGGGRR
jgi:indole-3-glycerol phosphate synthase